MDKTKADETRRERRNRRRRERRLKRKNQQEPERQRLTRGCFVQLVYEDWKHGPGKVVRFTPGGAAEVKWPRKGRRFIHDPRYLRRVDA